MSIMTLWQPILVSAVLVFTGGGTIVKQALHNNVPGVDEYYAVSPSLVAMVSRRLPQPRSE